MGAIVIVGVALVIVIAIIVSDIILMKRIEKLELGIGVAENFLRRLKLDLSNFSGESTKSFMAIGLRAEETHKLTYSMNQEFKKFCEEGIVAKQAETAASKAAMAAEKAFSEGLENILNYGGSIPKLNKEALKHE